MDGTRSGLPAWDLTRLYADIDAWRARAGAAERQLAAATANARRPDAELVELIEHLNCVGGKASRVTLYASCLLDAGGKVPDGVAAIRRRVDTALDRFTAATEDAIRAAGPDRLDAPALRPYRAYLRRVAGAVTTGPDMRGGGVVGPDARTAAVRLDRLAEGAYDARVALLDRDLGDSGQPRPQWAALRAPDRDTRARAFHGYFESLARGRHTAAELLRLCAEAHTGAAQLRGYASSAHAAAAAYEVDAELVDRLVAVVREHVDVLRRFLGVHRRRLALAELRPWDLFVPPGPDTGDIPFDSALRLIRAAFAPLGPRHHGFLDRALAEGWIDAEPRTGKHAGAYTGSAAGAPPFVLVTYRGGGADLSTLAHELGHAAHHHFSADQPHCLQPTRLISEAVATLHEVLLGRSVRAPEFLLQHLGVLVSRVFRQTMLVEFERWIHARAAAGDDLSADTLDARYVELVEAYYGDALAEPGALAHEWMRIPHLYWNHELPLYPLAAAAAFGLANAGPAIEDVLAAGSSVPAGELLAGAGVRLDEAGLRAFLSEIDQTVGAVENEPRPTDVPVLVSVAAPRPSR
jgi:oligoendopeptidase F